MSNGAYVFEPCAYTDVIFATGVFFGAAFEDSAFAHGFFGARVAACIVCRTNDVIGIFLFSFVSWAFVIAAQRVAACIVCKTNDVIGVFLFLFASWACVIAAQRVAACIDCKIKDVIGVVLFLCASWARESFARSHATLRQIAWLICRRILLFDPSIATRVRIAIRCATGGCFDPALRAIEVLTTGGFE